MYTTKSLSEFKSTPEAAQQPPEEGPNSGYLVIQEDEHRVSRSVQARQIRRLPFPQNKIMTVRYSDGDNITLTLKVLFVPVMNSPLSANRYYVVVAEGKHLGNVVTCAKESDMTGCCLCYGISHVKPKPFDHRERCQQIKIVPRRARFFTAKSIFTLGLVPGILSADGWTLHADTPKNYEINEALGLNNTIRSCLRELDVPISCTFGKWYCPFFLVKEGKSLKDQMKRAMFYEVTIEQFLEQAHGRVGRRRILFEGKEAAQLDEGSSDDGFIWFEKRGDFNGEKIGLSLALWERVKWEENRQGWIEEDGDMDLEVKFGSSVLVERLLFKRMDGSSVLALDFMHTNKVITK